MKWLGKALRILKYLLNLFVKDKGGENNEVQ